RSKRAPALLISTSMLLRSSWIRFAASRTLPKLDKSQCRYSKRPVLCRLERLSCNRFPRRSLRPSRMRSNPRAAKANAEARPIPAVAPVITQSRLLVELLTRLAQDELERASRFVFARDLARFI